jgi:hypothetical protein
MSEVWLSISVNSTILGSGETRLAMARRPVSMADRATGLPVRERYVPTIC